jgi:hypothetical protein
MLCTFTSLGNESGSLGPFQGFRLMCTFTSLGNENGSLGPFKVLVQILLMNFAMSIFLL